MKKNHLTLFGLILTLTVNLSSTSLGQVIDHKTYPVTVCVNNMSNSPYHFQAQFDEASGIDSCSITRPNSLTYNSDKLCTCYTFNLYEDCAATIYTLGIYPQDHANKTTTAHEYQDINVHRNETLYYTLYYGAPKCAEGQFCTEQNDKIDGCIDSGHD